MSYKQLTRIQRYQIYALLKTGQRQATVAKVLNVHRSTINRELRRNKGQRGYRPAQAHSIAIKRHYKHIPKITRADWAIVEAKLREPRVKDFHELNEITNFSGFYKNRISRILLVAALANLGSSIGTFVALPYLISLL